MEGRSKGKSLFFILFGEREKKNKNVRKRRHWPRVSATIAWKIWISRNRPGSIKFPTTTIRGICKCLFFLFYLDIVLSRSVRRVKPFPASYATASFILFPIKKNKPKVQREKTMSRRYIGVYQASSPFHLFPIVSPQRDSKFHVDLENSRNGGRFGEKEKKKKKKKIEKGDERKERKEKRFILWTFDRLFSMSSYFLWLNCFFDREFRKKEKEKKKSLIRHSLE